MLRRYYGKVSFLNIEEFLGKDGELVVDDTTGRVYVMDGVTLGGQELVSGSGQSTPSTSIELTGTIPYVDNTLLSTVVNFERPNNEINTVDAIDTGLSIKRGNNGAIYNSAGGVEIGYDEDVSPLGTEWNADGWGDLSDVQTRTYTTFYEATGGNNNVGSVVTHNEFVMHDTINDKYYKIKFHFWQPNAGGNAAQPLDERSGFSYTRTLLDLSSGVYFVRPADDSTVVDVVGPGLTIKRDSAGGLYNSEEDVEWDPDYAPSGTLWNDDGWNDFTDITTRTWKPLYSAVHGQLGNHLLGRELLMHDTINDQYYVIKFTNWGQNNGGSFAYWRREINPTGTKLGITFADGTIQKTAKLLGDLKVVNGNRIVNQADTEQGVEIGYDEDDNYFYGTYAWTGAANWVTDGNGGQIVFDNDDTSNGNQVDFREFLDNLDRWYTKTVSINGGEPQTITNWGNNTLYTVNPPATDPTLVTEVSFDVVFRNRMYIGSNNTIGFLLDKENNSFEVEARDINFYAGDDMRIEGRDTMYIRNNSATENIEIITDGNNTYKVWQFNADGTLTVPGTITAPNLIVDDGNISFLGNGSGIQGAMSFNLSTNNFTNNWNFSEDGKLTLPGSGVVLDTNGTPGLTREIYTAVTGWFNNNTIWFETNATLASTTVITGTIQGLSTETPGYAEQLYGYFKAPTTATYTFGLHADDAAKFWIGEYAVDGQFDNANADITYVWPNTVATYSVALTKDVYYPVRLQWGNNDGTAPNVGSLNAFWYSTDGGTTTQTDFTNTIYTEAGLTTVSKGGYEWQFGTDGMTSFPVIDGTKTLWGAVDEDFYIRTTRTDPGTDADIEINAADDLRLTAYGDDVELYANSSVIINTNWPVGTHQWTFGIDGGLTFPDATVQTTAYTSNNTTVAKTGATIPTTTGPINNFDFSPLDGSGGLVDGTYGPLTVGTVTFFAVVESGLPYPNYIATQPILTIGDTIGTIDSGNLGGTPGTTFTLTVSNVVQETPTAIDLTKTINKLTDGVYTLADGVEGQIMYLVRQTGTVFDQVTVIVANARVSGALYTALEHYPFSYVTSNVDIDTLIFTDGAWQAVGGDWD